MKRTRQIYNAFMRAVKEGSPAATLSKFNLSKEFVDQPFELVGVVLERKAPAYCYTHQRLDDGPIVEHDVADSLVEERV